MQKSIDFYMVTISPWCYFALKGLKSLFDEHKIEINFKPVDIMSIFKENQTNDVTKCTNHNHFLIAKFFA